MTNTEQPSQVQHDEPVSVGDSFEAKRPEWMSDTDWNHAIDELGDVWHGLLVRASRS